MYINGKQLLIYNIGLLLVDNRRRPFLAGREMGEAEILRNAWLLIEDGRFKDWGEGDADEKLKIINEKYDCAQPESGPISHSSLDCQGGAVLPSFCDSHTHLVYAGSREGEFVDKIRGLSYAEIARRGGGILNSADRLHQMSEDELYSQAMLRISEIMKKGTGAVEIKSGYGLNTVDELKNHMFYHGTRNYVGSMQPSMTQSERWAQEHGGGGYGQRYWGISVSRSKKVASNFGNPSPGVSIYPVVLAKGAKGVKICTMLLKPDVFKAKTTLDYVGMEIPNDFIVGYGLDFDELGRNLPDIYVLDK